MLQRFMHAGAVLAFGDVTARASHCGFYFIDRVRWTRGHSCDLAVQHRDVVVVIARSENVFARNVDQTREFGQDSALVVIGVAKAKENRVALIMKLRVVAARLDSLPRALREEPVDHSFSGVVDSAFLAVVALCGDAAGARARLRGVIDRLSTPGAVNVQGSWHAILAVIPTLMLLGERDECAGLYQSAVDLVSTGMVWSWLAVGPMVPQLAAGIAAHAGGLIEAAHAHFEEARRIFERVALSESFEEFLTVPAYELLD